jgi:hypothetical protein
MLASCSHPPSAQLEFLSSKELKLNLLPSTSGGAGSAGAIDQTKNA